MSTRALTRQVAERGTFRWKKLSSYTPYLFIAPLIILILTFTFYPVISGAKMSLTDAAGINPGEWVGFNNFKEVIQFEEFQKALFHTFYFMIGCFITQIPCAFILAYILNNVAKRLRGILRASFFVPVLINSVIVALIFRVMFNRDQGIVNWFMGLLHLPNNIDWIMTESLCIPLMIIAAFWQWTGYHMVYFLAQLQTIDASIYESAKLDGASPARVLWSIITPMMRPAFTFVMVTSGIGALMQFEYAYLIFYQASFGPNLGALTALAFIWRHGFSQNFRLGFATAASWILFAIIFIFSVIQVRMIGLGKSNEE
ncbi:MAG: sugar ABC transporter permease [Firmicutes bacterium]|nr:sugar ABC transporter permease [Bacillota bacterium]